MAINNSSTDYVLCATVLAKSIRRVEPDAKICLVSDSDIKDPVFDFVRPLPFGDQSQGEWKLHNDWQCFYASPFRQTIKLEADIFLSRSISHWFDVCQQKDLVVMLGARNYHNQLTRSRAYRQIFDTNDLPDVYNAITYWRLSPAAKDFFEMVRDIISNWDSVMSLIKFGSSQPVNTDLAYAIALKTLGPEKYTLPSMDIPSMIHMKPAVAHIKGDDWTRELVWEIDENSFRINTIEQMWPVHYHVKQFAEHLQEAISG